MLKLIELVLIAGFACRLFTGRWPWGKRGLGYARRGILRMTASPRHRQDRARARLLLGVEAGASRAAIIEAHKRLIRAVHPDQGGNKELAQEANAARDVLLAELAE